MSRELRHEVRNGVYHVTQHATGEDVFFRDPAVVSLVEPLHIAAVEELHADGKRQFPELQVPEDWEWSSFGGRGSLARPPDRFLRGFLDVALA